MIPQTHWSEQGQASSILSKWTSSLSHGKSSLIWAISLALTISSWSWRFKTSKTSTKKQWPTQFCSFLFTTQVRTQSSPELSWMRLKPTSLETHKSCVRSQVTKTLHYSGKSATFPGLSAKYTRIWAITKFLNLLVSFKKVLNEMLPLTPRHMPLCSRSLTRASLKIFKCQ